MILLIFYCGAAGARIGIYLWTPILQLAFTSLRWMSRWANPMPQQSGCPSGLFVMGSEVGQVNAIQWQAGW